MSTIANSTKLILLVILHKLKNIIYIYLIYPNEGVFIMESRRRRDRRGTRGRSGNSNYLQTVLIQSVICVMIIALVFLLRVVNIDVVQDIRKEVKLAVKGDTDIDGLIASTTQLFDGMTSSVKTIFGDEAELENAENSELENNKSEINTTEKLEKESSLLKDENTDFRIDEDILKALNSQEDKYVKNNTNV